MSDHPSSEVGWLGAGRMGSVLIRRLLAAGMDEGEGRAAGSGWREDR
jgi:hypothetical protein